MDRRWIEDDITSVYGGCEWSIGSWEERTCLWEEDVLLIGLVGVFLCLGSILILIYKCVCGIISGWVDVCVINIFSWCNFQIGNILWLTYYLCTFLQSRAHFVAPSFFHSLTYYFSTQIEFIKIYIGQLPLNLEEYHLKEILEPLAELKEVK